MDGTPTPAAPAAPWVAAGGCSSCPHRGTCHESRKRIQDPLLDVGRHYECDFHRGIQQNRNATVMVGARSRRFFLLGGGGS